MGVSEQITQLQTFKFNLGQIMCNTKDNHNGIITARAEYMKIGEKPAYNMYYLDEDPLDKSAPGFWCFEDELAPIHS